MLAANSELQDSVFIAFNGWHWPAACNSGILSGYVYTYDRPYSGIRKYVHLLPKILRSTRESSSRERHANETIGVVFERERER